MKVFKVKVFWFFKSFSVIESTDDNKLTRRIQMSLNVFKPLNWQKSPKVEMHLDYLGSKGLRVVTVRLWLLVSAGYKPLRWLQRL